ncbi:MAG: LysM peptidoglycan-binding domain-containing protein [Geobacter sp.]|nr:LysM peptidoglycan-binding domain-containing protein [Geobacter sp.]
MTLVTSGTLAWAGGPAPYEINARDLERLRSGGTKARKVKPAKRATAAKQAPADHRDETQPAATDSFSIYTVKTDDNLFKILMRDFGMSNRQAELLIPDVMRENGLSSSTRLTIGQKLRIPRQHRTSSAHKAHKSPHPPQAAETAEAEAPVTAPEPAKEEIVPVAEKPAVPEPTPAAAEQPGATVYPITSSDPDQIVNGILTALSLPWSRDRVIEGTTGPKDGERFSIKVDCYVEKEGKRFILTRGKQDPFAYTMLRLLAMAGYTIIELNRDGGFASLATQILTGLELPFTSGKFRFMPAGGENGAREMTGFLTSLPQKRAQVFLTDTPLDAIAVEQLGHSSIEAITVPEPAVQAPAAPAPAE